MLELLHLTTLIFSNKLKDLYDENQPEEDLINYSLL